MAPGAPELINARQDGVAELDRDASPLLAAFGHGDVEGALGAYRPNQLRIN